MPMRPWARHVAPLGKAGLGGLALAVVVIPVPTPPWHPMHQMHQTLEQPRLVLAAFRKLREVKRW